MNQDFQTHWTMSPIYYFVRVFGLAPYSIVNSESKTHWKVTKLSMLYNVIAMICTSLILVPVALFQNKYSEYTHADNITKNTDMFRRVIGIFLCFLCLLFSYFDRHKICKLMEDMNDFDRDIASIGITFNYKEMYRNNAICTVLNYLIIVLITLVHFVVYATNEWTLVLLQFYLYWVTCVLIFLVNHSMVIQFVGFAHMINTRFVALNKFITELFEPSLKNGPVKTNTWTTKQCHKTKIDTLTIKEIINSKHNCINTVCSMHYRLCYMGKELNAIYSIQILLTMGMSFIDLLIRFYRLYLILTSNVFFDLSFTQVWIRVTWGIMFFLLLIILTFFCSKMKHEANKCTVLLHQTNFEDDDETRASVEMFYLQMLHQKLEFSAGGFFPVDSSVLCMVVGTITTYLVILIQFQMADSKGL